MCRPAFDWIKKDQPVLNRPVLNQPDLNQPVLNQAGHAKNHVFPVRSRATGASLESTAKPYFVAEPSGMVKTATENFTSHDLTGSRGNARTSPD